MYSAKDIPRAPEDPIYGLMDAYEADQSPKKVNLGVGAYRDENGRPWILPVVQKVCTLFRYLHLSASLISMSF